MLQAKSIAFKHGFFTRYGGVSKPPYDSLNVANHVGDEKEAVEKNRYIVCKSLASSPDELVFLGKLGHSNKIIQASERAKGKEYKGYDAVMTDQAGILLGLSVADCMPIIIAEENARAVAVIHAGWRGLLAEVIPMTIEAMQKQYDIDPKKLLVAIGPSIKQESYEVEEDVYKHFSKRYLKDHVKNKKLLDLDLVAEDQLVASDVEQIENLKIDTFSDNRFFSHRRNNTTGRFFAGISL